MLMSQPDYHQWSEIWKIFQLNCPYIQLVITLLSLRILAKNSIYFRKTQFYLNRYILFLSPYMLIEPRVRGKQTSLLHNQIFDFLKLSALHILYLLFNTFSNFKNILTPYYLIQNCKYSYFLSKKWTRNHLFIH